MNFIPYKQNEYLENSFYQLPKELFCNSYYTELNLTSKVLYALLLDRLSLSIKNKWIDKNGNIYLAFSRKEVCDTLNLSNKTVTKAFKQLRDVKLIEERKQGFKKNNIIYVGKINHENNKTYSRKTSDSINGVSTITDTENLRCNYNKYNNTKYSNAPSSPKNSFVNFEQRQYFAEELEKLYSVKGLVEDRQFRKLESFKDSKFKFSDCASVGCNQITVRPDGILSICHCYSKTDKYIIGNIYDMTFDEAIKSNEATFWKNRAPIFNETCLNCEGIFICGKGCPAQGEALFGDRKEIDKPFCIHSKKSLVWLLKKLYETS